MRKLFACLLMGTMVGATVLAMLLWTPSSAIAQGDEGTPTREPPGSRSTPTGAAQPTDTPPPTLVPTATSGSGEQPQSTEQPAAATPDVIPVAGGQVGGMLVFATTLVGLGVLFLLGSLVAGRYYQKS